jgi:cell wall-associated NlpC family hydrolase
MATSLDKIDSAQPSSSSNGPNEQERQLSTDSSNEQAQAMTASLVSKASNKPTNDCSKKSNDTTDETLSDATNLPQSCIHGMFPHQDTATDGDTSGWVFPQDTSATHENVSNAVVSGNSPMAAWATDSIAIVPRKSAQSTNILCFNACSLATETKSNIVEEEAGLPCSTQALAGGR